MLTKQTKKQYPVIVKERVIEKKPIDLKPIIELLKTIDGKELPTPQVNIDLSQVADSITELRQEIANNKDAELITQKLENVIEKLGEIDIKPEVKVEQKDYKFDTKEIVDELQGLVPILEKIDSIGVDGMRMLLREAVDSLFNRGAKQYVSVRLTNGKDFYNAVAQAIVGSHVPDAVIKSSDGSEALVGTFGEFLVGHKVDDVVVTFKYPYYNTDYDMKDAIASGDGVVTVSDSLLHVSSDNSGMAIAETKVPVRYRAGHTGFADFTASFAGDGICMAGCFDDEDGFFVKCDGGSLSVGRRRGGVDVEIPSAQWNGNISPSNIDFTKINIYRILFGYLGVANAVFQIRLDGWKTLCVMKTEGRLTTTTVGNPSFPVRFTAQDGAAVSVGSINAGTLNGMEVYGARYFSFAGSKVLSGTNLATIAHFHNKTTYKGVTNKVKAALLRYKFFVDAPDAGNGTVQIKVIKDSTFTGTPSYTSVDTNNSIIEYDTSVTYSSGGRTLVTEWLGYTGGNAGVGTDFGGSENFNAETLGLYLLPDEHVCVTAQNVQGSTNVTVRVSFNWIELF